MIIIFAVRNMKDYNEVEQNVEQLENELEEVEEELEQEEGFCKLSKARREEIENLNNQNILIEHIDDLHFLESSDMVTEMPYGDEIPFH